MKKSKPAKRKRVKAATQQQRHDGAASASALAGDEDSKEHAVDEAEAKVTTEDEAKVAEAEASPMETT